MQWSILIWDQGSNKIVFCAETGQSIWIFRLAARTVTFYFPLSTQARVSCQWPAIFDRSTGVPAAETTFHPKAIACYSRKAMQWAEGYLPVKANRMRKLPDVSQNRQCRKLFGPITFPGSISLDISASGNILLYRNHSRIGARLPALFHLIAICF